MDLLSEVLLDAGMDTIKMLPFLLIAFLILETLEHYSNSFTGRLFQNFHKSGPLIGAAAGCIPQCGFSVLAANLYAGGVISVGTLLSVFLATSDEAILIMMGNPGRGKDIFLLLLTKVIIAVVAGYLIDLFLKHRITTPKASGTLCTACRCHEQEGILHPALHHTVKIGMYLFLFSAVLNLIIALFSMEQVSTFLLGNTIFQPLLAAAVGLIPNCAASLILTQLYLDGMLSFASVVAGLSTGAGVGLVVLFRENKNRTENLKILVTLYVTAVAAGMLLSLFTGRI